MEMRQGKHNKTKTRALRTLEPYEMGSQGQCRNGVYALFRARFTISPQLEGKTIAIKCRTNKEGWNAVKPQFIFYVDGDIRQAFDTNHLTAILSRKAAPGETHMLYFSVFGGLYEPGHEKEIDPVSVFISMS
jgi:hypothetical protein